MHRRQRGVRAHLVHEYQSLGVDPPSDERPPSNPQELVAFACSHLSFFRVQPIRRSNLLTVDSLTPSPATLRRYLRLCVRVAAGRSRRSASKSFLTRSSAFGCLPGLLFGRSDPPCRATLAYRLTEERPTPKVRATSTVGIPRSLASTIF